MSILYCAIPHFAISLAKRDNPKLDEQPLVLIDPEGQVFDVSTEAATCGVFAGMTSRAASIRCPEARLLEADVAHYRAERETLLQLLEHASPKVESHGWGAAYVDLGKLARDHSDAVTLCREIGRSVRKELGEALQPALGWDSSKFTAQTAARRTQPGNILAITAAQEQRFLQPLPVTLLPLPEDVLQRLCFLGLRTLGQYAELPVAAVWQQFGRAGKMAHRCARGEDDRPIIPRWQAPQLDAEIEFETPLVERERLMAELRRLVSPLLGELRANLQACGQVRLAVQFDDGSAQEKTRTFLSPLVEEGWIVRSLGKLLDGLHWQAAAVALAVTLGQIEDAVIEQLTLFPLKDEREGKLQEVQRYLAARFGSPKGESNHLRRAVIAQPGAPLPEWRVSWKAWDKP
jgi:DNA polymerase-4